MKNILLLSIVIFLLTGCKNPKSEKKLTDLLKGFDSIESIKSKKIDSSAVNFKKWIDGKDISYVHVLFKNYADKGMHTLSLKPKQKILSVIINTFKHEGKTLAYPYFTRYEPVIDLKFSNEDIQNFETNSSFKAIITSIKGDTNRIFKKSEDEELLKFISNHAQDKIQIVEFISREATGHFEGDKKLPVKNVRSFYLSDENKKALKESNSILRLLQ